MATSGIKSNMHLVPVLKGAVDPKKGIIFRTYYIRPEKLQQMIKEAREIPTKSYLVKIEDYNKIEYTAKTGNILPMYDVITKQPGGENVWKNIINRNNNFKSIAESSHHKQKMLQSMYGFIVSLDSNMQKEFGKNVAKASKKEVYDIETVIKENKPKTKKLKRGKIKESIKLIKDKLELKDFSKLIDETFKDEKYTKLKQEDVNELINKDFGFTVKYKVKTHQVEDSKNNGLIISNFINFMNTNPLKVRTIVSQMITKNTLSDKYHIVGNTMFKSHMYFNQAGFWKELLLKLISDIVENGDYYDKNMIYYYLLLLYKIDKETAKLVSNSLNLQHISLLLTNNINKILENDKLPLEIKYIYITSLTKSEAEKYTEYIVSFINTLENGNKIKFLGALLTNLSDDEAFKIIKRTTPSSLNIEIMFDSIINKNYDFKYHLLQITIAKLTKNKYIPYKELMINVKDPFTDSIATKITKPFIEKNKENLSRILKYNRNKIEKLSDIVEIGWNIPNVINNSNSLFIKFNPIESFDFYDNNKHDLKFTVSKKDILYVNDSAVIVYLPIKSLKFEDTVLDDKVLKM